MRSKKTKTTPKRKGGKPGRPSKITAELEKALFAEIADGSPTKAACRKISVSYSAVAMKLQKDEGFRDRRARAYLHGSVFYLDAAEEGLRTATPQNISVRREIAHHARWRAAKMLPAFSDRLKLDATLETTEKPTLEEDMEIARRLAFAIHQQARKALPENFAKSMKDIIKLAAKCISHRAGKTSNGQPDLRLIELAGHVEDFGGAVAARLMPAPGLPAPAEQASAELKGETVDAGASTHSSTPEPVQESAPSGLVVEGELLRPGDPGYVDELMRHQRMTDLGISEAESHDPTAALSVEAEQQQINEGTRGHSRQLPQVITNRRPLSWRR